MTRMPIDRERHDGESADAQVAPPDAAAPDLLPPDRGEGRDWRAALPEDLRDDPGLRDIRDVAALAKGYVHARRMVGADKIAVPGRGAGDEVWGAVFDRLGRPPSPEHYRFERPTDAALAYDEALEQAFRGRAHALGLLPRQAAGLHAWWIETTRELAARQADEMAARRAAAESELRRGWGGRFAGELSRAEAALRRFGDETLGARLAEGLGDDPAFIRFCARIGGALAEDTLAGAPPEAGPTRGDAKRRIAEVFADPRHPYFDRDDPRHEHAVETVRGLFEALYD